MHSELYRRGRLLTYRELCKLRPTGDFAIEVEHMRGDRPLDVPDVQVVMSEDKRYHLRSGAVSRRFYKQQVKFADLDLRYK